MCLSSLREDGHSGSLEAFLGSLDVLTCKVGCRGRVEYWMVTSRPSWAVSSMYDSMILITESQGWEGLAMLPLILHV